MNIQTITMRGIGGQSSCDEGGHHTAQLQVMGNFDKLSCDHLRCNEGVSHDNETGQHLSVVLERGRGKQIPSPRQELARP